MLKEQARFLNKLSILVDFLTVSSSFAVAYWLRDHWSGLWPLRNYLWILLIILPTWYFLLARFGLYSSLRMRPYSQVLAALVKVHLVGGIVTASIIYFVEPTGVSRALFGYFLATSFLFMSLERLLLKGWLGYLRRRGYNTRNILVIGSGVKAETFIDTVNEHADWGIRIVGVLQMADEPPLSMIGGVNVVGRFEELLTVCRFYSVDEVVFCLQRQHQVAMDEHLTDMCELGINVRLVLDLAPSRSMQEFSYFHDKLPILTYYCAPSDISQLFVKRCMDIVGACAGLLVTIIIFPLVALAIKLDSPGPLLFGQRRVGRNGRLFTCWKFRSMYVDAEQRKKDLAHLNEMQGAIFKIKDDPRITKVGRFLRKTSLDEFPQFWNVLRGEMSLVGTRPPTPDEVSGYANWQRRRICMKPGITGLWQVSGRNRITNFDEVVRLDLEYIDQWSIQQDLKIILKTTRVILSGH